MRPVTAQIHEKAAALAVAFVFLPLEMAAETWYNKKTFKKQCEVV